MPRHTSKVLFAAVAVLTSSLAARAAAPQASAIDRQFVDEVTQNALYEIEAGRVAFVRGGVPVVKDFGALETHDHMLARDELKRIAGETGVTMHSSLNAAFAGRLDKLKHLPQSQFDAAYIGEMKQLHARDEALFTREAEAGSAEYKSYAHNTAVLIRAHLGWLNTL